MSTMKADQERVSNLLTDTVTLLCRNGLQYKSEMKVQGLLGITLDDEVFLVHIDKKFGEMIGAELVALHASEETANSGESDASESSSTASGRKRNRAKRKRRASDSLDSQSDSLSGKKSNHVVVKPDPDEDEEDDLVMLEADSKIGLHDKDTMRESYGVSYNNDLMDSGGSRSLGDGSRGASDSSYPDDVGIMGKQDLDQSKLLEQTAGCSTWDDPLAALTGQNSLTTQGANSSCGDEVTDQQAMSTFLIGSLSNAARKATQLPTTSQYLFDEGGTKTVVSVDQDERLWQCTMCDKSYFSRRNLVTHMTNKHGVLDITGTQVGYKCNVPGCESKYNRRDNLLAHKRRAHGILTISARNPNAYSQIPNVSTTAYRDYQFYT